MMKKENVWRKKTNINGILIHWELEKKKWKMNEKFNNWVLVGKVNRIRKQMNLKEGLIDKSVKRYNMKISHLIKKMKIRRGIRRKC